MDYGRLSRRELQALCKEHGIPANKTNVYMAEALGALQIKPKESEESVGSKPDPAEVVKSKAKRAQRSKKVEDVLEESAVDDLSSQLAKSTLAADSAEGIMVESGGEDIRETVVEAMIEVPSELLVEVAVNLTDVGAETAKVPRRIRTQTSRNMKSLAALVDAAPALAEPTLEVVLRVEDMAEDSLASATPDLAPESRVQSTYTRRVLKVKEPELHIAATHIPIAKLSSATSESILSPEEDTKPTASFAPVEETMVEDTMAAAKPVTKKSRVKGKKSKKVQPVSPISLPILEDGVLPPTTGITSRAAMGIPDSPTLGLAYDPLAYDAVATQDIPQGPVSLSPAPQEEFEFQSVPESFAEIMTPGKPLVAATKGCQHRIGRRLAKSCKSCASEVANVMQEVHNGLCRAKTIDMSSLVKAPFEAESGEEQKEEILTTPAKQSDDKENSVKNADLHSLSMRKLQKEVQRRGLSKRNNTRVKV